MIDVRCKSIGWYAGTRTAVGTIGLLVLTGCAHHQPSVYGAPGTSAAPNLPWVAPQKAIEQDAPRPPSIVIPPGLLGVPAWGLADVIDIALRNSSETRASWAVARSAAAAYGSTRGDYLPNLNVASSAARAKGSATTERPAQEQRTYGTSADVTWIIFNFGGRKAAVEETRQSLLAADWTHNAVIQEVILSVQQAYYEYVKARSLLAVEEATLHEAQTSLDAAEERYRAGLATVVEILQARTVLSQVQLSVESLRGRIATTRGALATAIGLPANTIFDVELPPEDLPVPQMSDSVEHLLGKARANRPDLAAARAQVVKARAHVRKVKAEGYPTLSATGTISRVFRDDPDDFSDTYSAALQVKLPAFTGLSHGYDVREAEAEADLARVWLQNLEQSVLLQVWTSYFDLKTAEQRLKASDDLLRSATELLEVARGQYQSGVGTILDLLSAQAALEDARAQRVKARSDWFLSLAQLAYGTGTLGPSGTAVFEGDTQGPQKGSTR